MRNYRLTITRIPSYFGPHVIDLHRWAWSLGRKDGTIGYTDSGESYTWLGAYFTPKYRLWKHNRPIRRKEFDL